MVAGKRANTKIVSIYWACLSFCSLAGFYFPGKFDAFNLKLYCKWIGLLCEGHSLLKISFCEQTAAYTCPHSCLVILLYITVKLYRCPPWTCFMSH